MRKAVSLFSGSLSSSIATEIIVNHYGADRVVLVTFRSPFFRHHEEVKEIANSLWPEAKFRSKSIKRRTENIVTSDGKFPDEDSFCFRCRLALLKTGRDFLDRTQADFLVSGERAGVKGEVWKERLAEIEKRAGVEGQVFRPLSPSLSNTLPERRDLDIPLLTELKCGKKNDLRGLAENLDLERVSKFYGSGKRCKLTSSGYRRRLKDLADEKDFNVNDLRLLDFDGYYKIPPDTKLVLADTPEEKRELHNYFLPKDLRFYLPNHEGPMGLVRSDWETKADEAMEKVVNMAASITVAESEVEGKTSIPVNYRFEHENETYSLDVAPLETRLLAELSL